MKITITIETGARDGVVPMTITREELERFAERERERKRQEPRRDWKEVLEEWNELHPGGVGL